LLYAPPGGRGLAAAGIHVAGLAAVGRAPVENCGSSSSSLGRSGSKPHGTWTNTGGQAWVCALHASMTAHTQLPRRTRVLGAIKAVISTRLQAGLPVAATRHGHRARQQAMKRQNEAPCRCAAGGGSARMCPPVRADLPTGQDKCILLQRTTFTFTHCWCRAAPVTEPDRPPPSPAAARPAASPVPPPPPTPPPRPPPPPPRPPTAVTPCRRGTPPNAPLAARSYRPPPPRRSGRSCRRQRRHRGGSRCCH